jgi:hypothetical protein
VNERPLSSLTFAVDVGRLPSARDKEPPAVVGIRSHGAAAAKNFKVESVSNSDLAWVAVGAV